MCGIVLVKREEGLPAGKVVAKRYRHQDSRGKQGFGYIPVEDGYIKRIERDETEEGILAKLKEETSNEILFHHRYPTSTPNYGGATHPIAVEHEMLEHNYYVIHNGVIRNADEMKKNHDELGFVYTTEYIEDTSTTKTVRFNTGDKTETIKEISTISKYNDSESFAINLARYIEGQVDAIRSAGTISFIAYQTDKKGKVLGMYYGHNDGNPMMLEYTAPKKGGGMMILKSLGSGRVVPANRLYRINYEDGSLVEDEVDIGVYSKYVPKTYNAHNKSNNQQDLVKKLIAGEPRQSDSVDDIVEAMFSDADDGFDAEAFIARGQDEAREHRLKELIQDKKADIQWYAHEMSKAQTTLREATNANDIATIQMEITQMEEDIIDIRREIYDAEVEISELDQHYIPTIMSNQTHLLD